MTPYLLLLILAVLAYAATLWLVRTNRLPDIATWIVLLGTSTAFLAMLVSQMMSFWYALLVILGLSFATAVLLAKQQEAK
ncbi:hypothetical protein [Sporosarcina sp. ZBG7A]|uniref:hypothetical protein n=1 Tax=Sporosarcina sp. ZBG7A TaxID=1582223 RepID=UPI00057B796E|nr:hypothetical protein [Sporosarcina sp. ZBG7A]